MKVLEIELEDKTWRMSQKQTQFLKSDKKYVCYSGGMGCGKSLALVLKIIQLSEEYPNNYGLLGRVNYSDLRDTTMKDFFDICPPRHIKSYNKQEKRVTFHNNSQLIFRGLKEVKKTEVRSLNLGFFALEQAEEIDEALFDELSARLRRDIRDFHGKEGVQQGFLICNPAIMWIYKRFKQHPLPEYEVIEGSMLDNSLHLPESYLKDRLAQPESWKRQFVYGIWDESALSEKAVFASEYIQEQAKSIAEPIRILGEIDIYREKEPGEEFQIGVDPSEGAEDFSVIKAVSKWHGDEIASFSKRLQPDLLAYQIDKMGRFLSRGDLYPKVVLEVNGIGLATLNELQHLNYPDIYIREIHDHHSKIMTKKLGWLTTHTSKPLLIGHFQDLLGKKFPKIRDKQTIEEMKTFVYSPEASKRGMGAEKGFYDDRIMAMMLAYWDIKGEKVEGSDQIVVRPQETREQGELLHIEDWIDQPRQKKWLEL